MVIDTDEIRGRDYDNDLEREADILMLCNEIDKLRKQLKSYPNYEKR